MKRASYSNSIKNFLLDSNLSILGELSINHTNRTLEDLQRNAWLNQIQILKDQLIDIDGQIYFEFTIPRMGKRVDNIIIINDTAFIVEFKVGYGSYEKYAIEQVIDYTIDLKNFHEGSHNIKLVPILVVTNAKETLWHENEVLCFKDAAKANKKNLNAVLKSFLTIKSNNPVNINEWENSIYKPTPTIIEAAQALYKGHNVKEISRSDSGAINLSKTSNCINRIIDYSKTNNQKSICLITGVPGAGKTLAGLNIANERMKADEDEHAVFLSGNGPLVDVLREALARDIVETSKLNEQRVNKKDAMRESSTFIQNIHHFRDEYLKYNSEPTEKVVVFDEAQRAWTKEKTSSFMKIKKGIDNFNMSEPQFLIDVMNRHKGWCTIICLIGGGQEINTGEAGIEEWIEALKNHYENWNIHYSNLIIDNKNYLKSDELKNWVKLNAISETELHLAVSIRSFRSEKLSSFVQNLLDLNIEKTKKLYQEIKFDYPIVITRDLETAKKWLKEKGRGSERIGLISSSGAKRLKSLGIDVKNEISAPNWFLNKSDDVRASYFLEDIATEFDIQGLEIDWSCIAWGANFYLSGDNWKHQNFKGCKWQNINKEIDKEYLKNTYRVLLTRARQGMIIFLPNGSNIDYTRSTKFYDETYHYLKSIGISEL